MPFHVFHIITIMCKKKKKSQLQKQKEIYQNVNSS